MTQIFISHSSKDKEIVESFLDDILFGSFGIHHADVFCTSLDGMKITSGEDWRNEIKNNLTGAKIGILIITPNYKESEICLNELGAIWVSEIAKFPIFIEPISYETVGIILNPLQCEKLNSETSLDRLCEKFKSVFPKELSRLKPDRWTTSKRKFLMKLEKHTEKHPFALPVSREAFDEAIRKYNELDKSYSTLLEENMRISEMNEKLKNAKDKDEIAQIEKQYSDEDEITLFEDLCSDFSSALIDLHPAVKTVVYNEFSGKSLELDFDNYSVKLEEARARGLISEDWNIEFSHPKIKKIQQKYELVQDFINGKSSPEFAEKFEAKYDTVLSIDSLDFWENVLRVKLYYK